MDKCFAVLIAGSSKVLLESDMNRADRGVGFMISIRYMNNKDIVRIREIDRTEHIKQRYKCVNGKLIDIKGDWQAQRWDLDECNERVEKWAKELAAGGTMIGAFDGEKLVGSAILGNIFRDGALQLVALHISRDYRRRGIASRLFDEVCVLAKERGANELYVSAHNSESAVGFYRSKGCKIAEKPNQELFELEPVDIHMLKIL